MPTGNRFGLPRWGRLIEPEEVRLRLKEEELIDREKKRRLGKFLGSVALAVLAAYAIIVFV